MSIDNELRAWNENPLAPGEQELVARIEHLLQEFQRGEIPTKGDALTDGLYTIYQSTTLYRSESRLLDPEYQPQPIKPAPKEQPTTPLEATPLPDPFPGEFKVLRELGQGAFGKVWLAEDLNLNRRLVALKTLKYAGDRSRLAALRREAGILAGFHHPNLVEVYAWRESRGEPYLILQFVSGGSLWDRLRETGSLTWDKAARYIADVSEGLLAVHERGIVHQDIKPGNILWDEEKDEALLTDFGVAAHLADGEGPGGTLPFMPPESLRGIPPTPAADVYSLAVTLFVLVTNDFPFQGLSTQEIHAAVCRGLPTIDPRCSAIPDALEKVIRAGLEADLERRPSLPAFLEQLRGALNCQLADTLPRQPAATAGLDLTISKEVRPGQFQAVASTTRRPPELTRDLKKVPASPPVIELRTGDWIRIEVESERTGYVTVFNIGPTGNLNLLFPDIHSTVFSGPSIQAGCRLPVQDVEMCPPAGRERLFAIWTARPLQLRLEQLREVADRRTIPLSTPYVATRDMAKVQQAIQHLRPEDYRIAVLEVDHLD